MYNVILCVSEKKMPKSKKKTNRPADHELEDDPLVGQRPSNSDYAVGDARAPWAYNSQNGTNGTSAANESRYLNLGFKLNL